MDISTIGDLISTVGFPIFVAVFMLWKSSNDTKALTETVSELKNAITELSTLLKNKEVE